jgi:hypothetical protein
MSLKIVLEWKLVRNKKTSKNLFVKGNWVIKKTGQKISKKVLTKNVKYV